MDHLGPTITFSEGLDIQGKLIVPESISIHVVSPLIVVQGELVILATQKPVDGEEQVVFTLTGEDEEQTFTPVNENANKCFGAPKCKVGKKAFIVAGGMVDIQGISKDTPTWTLLYDIINDDTIVLNGAITNWAPGAEILITSHTRVWNEHQVRKIESISTVSGKTALQLNETIIRPTTFVEDEDFATEVALLSRNILIQGGTDLTPWHGGHFMVHHTPTQRQWLQGVEFRNMGQQALLGRYPIHFHFCEESPMSVISKNTIRQSNQRCVVIHGTNRVRVEENVAFDTKGHCFMLEDGMEVGNEFIRNLGAQTGAPDKIIPDNGTNGEESDNEPATFWITSPTNSFIGNVAAGSESSGYWFEPYLRGERKSLFPYTQPMKAPLTLFKDNVAHSNVGKTGAIRMYVPGYLPEEIAVFDGIKSFRNNASGIFLHKNYNILVQNSLFADNNIGIDIDRAEGIEVRDTVIIGESESYRRLMERQDVDPVCSQRKVIGIDLHTWTIFQGYGGSTLRNIDFSGFSNTACPIPRALNMDDHNIEQGQFEHFTTFHGVRMSDEDKASLSFCDLVGTDIETVYLVDLDGSLSPTGIDTTTASVLLSNGANIQKFVDPSNCVEILDGCYTYCKDTCFRSIRYEIEGPKTEGYELKICDATNTQDCAYFFDSRRDNQNRNGHLDPRTFIAHVPVGRTYEGTFLTNTGAVYRPTDLKITVEKNLCPIGLGQSSISIPGFTMPPTHSPVQTQTQSPSTDERHYSSPSKSPTVALTNTVVVIGELLSQQSLNQSSCFPGMSELDVLGKGRIRMDQLELGDLVKTMTGTFSPVLSFAHRDMTTDAVYLELQANSTTLHVSADHLLYVNGYISNAESIEVGDALLGADDRIFIVEQVQRKTYEGAYAPITKAGTLLVADVAVSSYVKVLNKIPSSFQHVMWHSAYAPLRLVHDVWNSNVDESYTKGISNYVAFLIPIQSFLNKSPMIIQIIALIAIGPFVVSLAIIEQAFWRRWCSAVGAFTMVLLITMWKARLTNKRIPIKTLR